MTCSVCKQVKDESEFSFRLERKRLRQYQCKICALETSKKVRRKLKTEFLQAYGGICTCCGEAEPAFLTLEHINGGGHKERLEAGGNVQLLRKLKKLGWPKEGYTVECYNCNLGKRSNNGVCPHRG